MRERQVPPKQDPKDEFVFHDNDIPTLTSDVYTVTATSTLTVASGETVTGTSSLTFKVAGPQLVLPPDEIAAKFPANTARGMFYQVLPHVTLTRTSLPWERLPAKGATGVPWLVLLVLSQKQLAQAARSTTKVSALAAKGIAADDTDPEAQINLLDLPARLVADLLPDFDDLKWLAHVRSVTPKNGPGAPETATLVSANLPVPAQQNHAFLISVEGRYAQGNKPTGALTFPVLHEWTFFCEAEHSHGFAELLMQAQGPNGHPEPFALPTPDGAPPAAALRYEKGYVPVVHHMRRGEVSAAWLRSPLSVGEPPDPTPAQKAHLPAQHSDGFLTLDPDFAMLDVTYSGAWELGRLLMLEQTELATDLYHWKRAHAQASHLAQNPVPGLTPDPLPPMPGPLAQWITHNLIELRSVPFGYLVPDKGMLPPNSLRFFDVDRFWLDCLRDGALSVGRSDSGQHKREADMRKSLAYPDETSGLLLRSAAVSDFPHLEIDAYSVDLPNADPVGTTAKPLDILRFERLSRDVLLVLFTGRVRTADLHLHPQAVHFGFEARHDASGTEYMRKETKHLTPKMTVDIGATPPLSGLLPSRRVQIDALAKKLVGARAGTPGDVATFALQMLEGVPLVRFRRAD